MRSDSVVGVVIPTLDGQRYLAEAIESVLRQTHQALDILVADDGSTDATRDVAGSFAPEVRCLSLPRRGLGATRNSGVEAVRGDYIAFLDQDDVWQPRKLELQLRPFDRRVRPDVVFGCVREFITAVGRADSLCGSTTSGSSAGDDVGQPRINGAGRPVLNALDHPRFHGLATRGAPARPQRGHARGPPPLPPVAQLELQPSKRSHMAGVPARDQGVAGPAPVRSSLTSRRPRLPAVVSASSPAGRHRAAA
jgi:Glycosyl transferase family 2